MHGRFLFLFLLSILFLSFGCAQEEPPVPPYALQIAELRDSLSVSEVSWPGFDPSTVPLAVFRNDTSWLVDFPEEPESFEPVSGWEGLYAAEGRHPVINANTTAELEGITITTLLIDSTDSDSLRGYASIALHESFHAFENERYPQWQANEAVLFSFPFHDPELLKWLVIETQSLKEATEALAKSDQQKVAQQTGFAVAARDSFNSRSEENVSEYLNSVELHEGLARYVEQIARGNNPREMFLRAGHIGPEEVRLRGYLNGAGKAFLLDEFTGDWKAKLDHAWSPEGSPLSLTDLLRLALQRENDLPDSLPDDLVIEGRKRAGLAIRNFNTHMRSRLWKWKDAEGFRVIVDASDSPLFAIGFDPMNMLVLEDNRMFHERWIALKNGHGRIEMMNQTALTAPAGDHPLFQGIERVEVVGLDEPPHVEQNADSLFITWPGGEMHFNDVAIEDREGVITVRL